MRSAARSFAVLIPACSTCGLEFPAQPIRAREHQVIGCDRAADLRRRAVDEIDAVLRGQMLQDEAQAGELPRPFRQVALDEHRFAVEDVDLGIHVLAVHQERHADLFHPLQHAHDLAVVGNAGGRVGGGIGGIELDPGEHAFREPALDVIGIGVVGEVARQQRLERRALRHRRHHALAIGDGVLGGGDRRNQVRHQDGAAEMPGRVRQDRLEHGAVAHVQVPVVRLADGDAVIALIPRSERISCHAPGPIGAVPRRRKVSRGASSIIAPVRSATRAKPRLRTTLPGRR